AAQRERRQRRRRGGRGRGDAATRGTGMSNSRIGVYPGTFDPITNGHTDIILRATKVVDRLVIGVAQNIGKGPLFTAEERVAIVKEEIANLADAETRQRVEVRSFDNLLMHFA